MKINGLLGSSSVAASLFCAATLGINSVHAADAACAAMIKQTLPRPDLPYRVEQEMKIDGVVMKSQAVYIEGYMHVKQGAGKVDSQRKSPSIRRPWKRSRCKPRANAKSAALKCSAA